MEWVDDPNTLKALITDLLWQIDQIATRGIKNDAGNPYKPAHFARRLERAIEEGNVPEQVKAVVHKPPSQGFKRLEAHGSLDLAPEALVADADRPYASLFSEEDRAAAQARLAPHAEAIAKRTADHRDRMDAARAKLRKEGFPLRDELDAQLRRNRQAR